MDGHGLGSFADEIERVLRGTGWRYQREARVKGLEADFLVWSPDGESFVLLELKPLVSDREQMAARSAVLAERVRELAGARRVFLVTLEAVAGADRIESDALRLVALSALADALRAEFSKPTTYAHAIAAAAVISRGRVFAAMPFAAEFDDVFFVGLSGAAERLGLAAYRVDYDDYSGDVVVRIKDAIAKSRVVVADLSRRRPNVLYEMGYAHGRNITVVPIYSEEMSTLPFDVSHESTLPYELGRTTRLRENLVRRLGTVLGVAAPSESNQ